MTSAVLEQGEGWTKRWTTTWKVTNTPVVCLVRDLASFPVQGTQPVRRFSWRTSQHHRPGLQYLVSTGRHHGFESHAEQELLLALDFAGELVEVLSQPFRLAFQTSTGSGAHIPDFLVWTRSGTWLVDVRPGHLVKPEDTVRFAAAAEVALACGWRYTVVPGWLPHIQTTLDTLSSQRRPMADRLGLQRQVLDALADGPLPFGDLVQATTAPAVARAAVLHLLWHRRAGVDLSAPLTDRTVVHRAGRQAGRP